MRSYKADTSFWANGGTAHSREDGVEANLVSGLFYEPVGVDNWWLLPGRESGIWKGLGTWFWYGVRTGGGEC